MQFSPFHRTLFMNITKTCSIATSIIVLTSCGSSGRDVEKKSNGEFQADHGPFDSQGNYIEGWADNPPKRSYKKSTSKSTTAKKITPTKITPKKSSTTKSTSKSVPAKTTSKPKVIPKPTVKPTVKPTIKPRKIIPKSKPPVMHTVSKGDTIYGLARKYGADPNTIIKVNSIKNGMIRLGQRLVIPRK